MGVLLTGLMLAGRNGYVPRLPVRFTHPNVLVSVGRERQKRVTSAMLLWTLAAALADDPRCCSAVPEYFLRACTDTSSCACRSKESSVLSHPADQSPSRVAAVAATAPARNSPGTDPDPDDVSGNAPIVSGTYIYGFDSAGNPTLTDAGPYRPSHGKLPD
jgi:hypothetical protein